MVVAKRWRTMEGFPVILSTRARARARECPSPEVLHTLHGPPSGAERLRRNPGVPEAKRVVSGGSARCETVLEKGAPAPGCATQRARAGAGASSGCLSLSDDALVARIVTMEGLLAARGRRAKRARRAPKRDRPQCGARCRSKGGRPCVARVCVRDDGSLARRCRLHGGLSTGPRTEEGRARCTEAGRRGAAERWRRWREGKATEAQARDRALHSSHAALADPEGS